MRDSESTAVFLAAYPEPIREQTARLRALVQRAVPEAVERLRPGWRLIGYDVPVGRRVRYFAYVAPEHEHVHLGFEHGALLDAPERLLHGAELKLRQVRYLTFQPGDDIPEAPVITLIRRAAAVAALSRTERASLDLVRDLSRGC